MDKGRLQVAIKFAAYPTNKQQIDPKERKGTLHISVKKASGLPVMDPNGLTDASVKMCLLPKQNSFARKKTETINDSLDPVWNEDFEFKLVSSAELASSRVLEFTVWDYDRRGCKDFIGCIRLGPGPPQDATNRRQKDWMDSTEEEAGQWAAMLERPGEWVEREHSLRTTIQSLNVSAPLAGDDITLDTPDRATPPSGHSRVHESTAALSRQMPELSYDEDTGSEVLLLCVRTLILLSKHHSCVVNTYCIFAKFSLSNLHSNVISKNCGYEARLLCIIISVYAITCTSC